MKLILASHLRYYKLFNFFLVCLGFLLRYREQNDTGIESLVETENAASSRSSRFLGHAAVIVPFFVFGFGFILISCTLSHERVQELLPRLYYQQVISYPVNMIN